MKTLEKAQDKIQKICDELRRETLDPAKKEAERIIEEAQARADEILNEAAKKSEKIIEAARASMEQERNVFESSLVQASKQTIETLRQNIEQHFFNEQLNKVLEKPLKDPQVIANLINAMIQAIQKEGISANFSALIPDTVSDKDINALLLKNVLEGLKEKSVVVGTVAGGVQVKLHDKKLTIDMSKGALTDFLSRHLRKGFRKMLFES